MKLYLRRPKLSTKLKDMVLLVLYFLKKMRTPIMFPLAPFILQEHNLSAVFHQYFYHRYIFCQFCAFRRLFILSQVYPRLVKELQICIMEQKYKPFLAFSKIRKITEIARLVIPSRYRMDLNQYPQVVHRVPGQRYKVHLEVQNILLAHSGGPKNSMCVIWHIYTFIGVQSMYSSSFDKYVHIYSRYA